MRTSATTAASAFGTWLPSWGITPLHTTVTYVFGKQQVTIRPAAAWNFLLPDRPAGQAIRALTWLGPDQAAAALPELRRALPPVEWDALLSVRAELPLWLAELLSEQPLEPHKARG
ncbi:MAG: hypothetical protein KFB97_04800 [Cyanobium sp. M30B3]|nr:MAG: hypothetical protein KFB97_04800 [Cyanobium sp. M30B3]